VNTEREYDARRHRNGPVANRTIDTSTMIHYICCTRSWIYVWYYGGGIILPLARLVLVLLVLRGVGERFAFGGVVAPFEELNNRSSNDNSNNGQQTSAQHAFCM
jgi:hypothetical protein